MPVFITQEDINRQKTLIGEFIIQFEHVSNLIRIIILRICYPNYSVIQNNNIETLLEGLTADPLRKKCEALIYDNFTKTTELIALSNALSKKFSELIQVRNSITHGNIMLGWANFNGELSPDKFSLKHPKTTKKGIDRNSIIVHIKNIEDLISNTRHIEQGYDYLYVLTDQTLGSIERKQEFLSSLRETIGRIGAIKLEPVEMVNK